MKIIIISIIIMVFIVMMENIKMADKMVMEFKLIKMEINIKVNGKMEEDKEWDNILKNLLSLMGFSKIVKMIFTEL